MSVEKTSDLDQTKFSSDFQQSQAEETLSSSQTPLKRMPTFQEYQEYQAALQKVEDNCSL